MIKKTGKNPFARSPTLDTVLMVEGVIRKYSGECNRRQFWQKLPKKVMWQTYVIIIDYLLVNGKIAADREGHLAWIWDPEGVQQYLKRKDLLWK